MSVLRHVIECSEAYVSGLTCYLFCVVLTDLILFFPSCAAHIFNHFLKNLLLNRFRRF